MTPWSVLKKQFGFVDEDAARLKALIPVLIPRIGQCATDTMKILVEELENQGITVSSERRTKIQAALMESLEEFLKGPHDEEFCEARKRKAHDYLYLGADITSLMAALSTLRSTMLALVFEHLPTDEAQEAVISICRAMDLDMAVLTTTFMEAKEAKELRSLQDIIIKNIPATVICLDENGRVNAATASTYRLFGESSGKPPLHYQQFFPRAMLEGTGLFSRIETALHSDVKASIHRVSWGEGPNTRFFQFHILPLDHDLARVLIHIEEYTEMVRAEAQAQQAETLARVGNLATNVAHEIRNPLTAISTTLQVIGSSMELGDRRRNALRKAHDQIQRMDRLVMDLLSYARPAVARPTRLSIEQAVRELLPKTSSTTEIHPRGDSTALADSAFLKQILSNLLENANDAVGANGRTRILIGPGPQLVVTDDGPGVPPPVEAAIFVPFITTKAKGTGLGLAISQKLAEAMGANLELLGTGDEGASLESDLLPGASFKLSLRSA